MALLMAHGTVLVILGALLAGGCGDSGGAGPSSGIPASVEASFSSLEIREDTHHRAAEDATDRMVLRAETARYAMDMDSLMDTMMDSCRAMGSGGMMRHHDMGRMGEAAGWMDEVVGEHRARMDALLTLDEMRGECAEHHAAMLDLLDEIHDALRGRGMMGGGMMGGGMI